MLELNRHGDTKPTPEPMPLFAWIAVVLALAATTASLILMKIVAGF